jgi:hypothetical protein
MPHKQCVTTSLQPTQRSFKEPPRAKKGFVLRAKRAARKRETACGASDGVSVDKSSHFGQ